LEGDNEELAKQCALICVDEILKASETKERFKNMIPLDIDNYWREVKLEINKL
jgi:hypothetical protein